jgi:putative transposase
MLLDLHGHVQAPAAAGILAETTGAELDALKRSFTKVCEDFEAELTAFEGERDYVHLPVVYPPKVAVAKLVDSLKGASSRTLRKEVPAVAQARPN